MWLFFIVFFASVSVTALIVVTKHRHVRLTSDILDGVQKVHDVPTPRIGGLALFLATVLGIGTLVLMGVWDAQVLVRWLVVIFPVFLGGFCEDLWKNVSPRARLILAIISAILAYFLLNANISHTGYWAFDHYVLSASWMVPGIDISVAFGSLFVSVLAMSGLAHAVNVIDGYNGLMLGYSAIVLGLIVALAYRFGASYEMYLGIIALAATLGLLVFNFPMGWIFTGDGGAYLMGTLLGIICISLSNSTPVSPWLLMVWLVYPGTELFFSILRKRLEGRSSLQPDSYHLHLMLLPFYRQKFPSFSLRSYHVMVTMTLLAFFLPVQLISLWFVSKTIVLFWLFVLMVCLYLLLYWFIRKEVKCVG